MNYRARARQHDGRFVFRVQAVVARIHGGNGGHVGLLVARQVQVVDHAQRLVRIVDVDQAQGTLAASAR
jgi:hypothetical protein